MKNGKVKAGEAVVCGQGNVLATGERVGKPCSCRDKKRKRCTGVYRFDFLEPTAKKCPGYRT